MGDNITSLLKSTSYQVQLKLAQAGWRPGVCRAKSKHAPDTRDTTKWQLFANQFIHSQSALDYDTNDVSAHASRLVIDELYGIRVTPVGSAFVSEICFSTELGASYRDDMKALGSLLGSIFIPIGEVVSESVVCLSIDGRLFLVGSVAPGVFYGGNTFAAGMECLLNGQEFFPVLFDRDADRNYCLPGLSSETPRVVIASELREDLLLRRLS